MTILNLGSLRFRAGRHAEAFEAYRHGLERVFTDGTMAARFGQSLWNASQAGLASSRFAETAMHFELLAVRSASEPFAINLWGIAGHALAKAARAEDAIIAFERALALHAAMTPRDAEAWLEAITQIASRIAPCLQQPHRKSLRGVLAAFEGRARIGGWLEPLRALSAWQEVMIALSVEGAC